MYWAVTVLGLGGAEAELRGNTIIIVGICSPRPGILTPAAGDTPVTPGAAALHRPRNALQPFNVHVKNEM